MDYPRETGRDTAARVTTGTRTKPNPRRREARARGRFAVSLALLLVVALGCIGPVEPPPAVASLSLGVEGSGSGSLQLDWMECAEACELDVVLGSHHTIVAAAAVGSEFAGWRGCDSVTDTWCAVHVTSSREVWATFNLQNEGPEEPEPEEPEPEEPEPEEPEPEEPEPEEPEPEEPEPGEPEPPAVTGNLVVTFSGLPTGLEDLGHATLTGPTGEEIALLESTTFTEFPVGEYSVSAHGLEVCTSNVLPLPHPLSITVVEDETAQLHIEYGAEGISPLGFKAVIRGIHADASEVQGYLTVTEEGQAVSVIGCFIFLRSGYIANSSIREGNPFDVYVETAPIVWILGPTDQGCSNEDAETCYIYVGGVHYLNSAERGAFRSGDYYFHADSPGTYGALVAQIGSEADPPVPSVGGELVVNIGTMPPELQNDWVCLQGHFTMQWDSYLGELCLDLVLDTGQHVFSDIFSGEYEAFLSGFGGNDPPAGLVITGSPVQVRAGEVATISVEFE